MTSPTVMFSFGIRRAQPADRASLAQLRQALWPESSVEEHSSELTLILAGNAPGTLPQIVLIAEAGDGSLIGFLEIGLRSHAEGCDPSHPVGYLEGLYVGKDHRQRGVCKSLVAAAEEWARGQGSTEMASDAAISNTISQNVHEHLGYRIVERSVNFRKPLR